MMCHVEDLRQRVAPTLRISDEAEKKKAREELSATFLPTWAGYTERQIGDGPFFGGSKLNVVDIKLYIAVRWLAGGTVDHVPATIFDAFPKLMGVHASVRDDARVRAWYAKSA
jgi:glutathione S-transferase